VNAVARLLFPLCVALVPAARLDAFATLTPEAAQAFDRYVASTEQRLDRELASGEFLRLDRQADVKAKLRKGELLVEPGSQNREGTIKAPNAMIQDWLGSMFIPRATIAQVKSALQDYENYKQFYQPEVIDSKQINRQGDEYDIFLRLFEHHVLTVVLNTDYHVRYSQPHPQHLRVTSRSTRIAEARKADGPYSEELPDGGGHGFLWRLNAYWHFEEADGGVYAECEAISLSRDVPLGLGWMLKGFLERFPKESMMNTLRGTLAAASGRASTN